MKTSLILLNLALVSTLANAAPDTSALEIFRANEGRVEGNFEIRQEPCYLNIYKAIPSDAPFSEQYELTVPRYSIDGKFHTTFPEYPDNADRWTHIESGGLLEWRYNTDKIAIDLNYDPQTLQIVSVAFPGTNERCLLRR